MTSTRAVNMFPRRGSPGCFPLPTVQLHNGTQSEGKQGETSTNLVNRAQTGENLQPHQPASTLIYLESKVCGHTFVPSSCEIPPVLSPGVARFCCVFFVCTWMQQVPCTGSQHPHCSAGLCSFMLPCPALQSTCVNWKTKETQILLQQAVCPVLCSSMKGCAQTPIIILPE